MSEKKSVEDSLSVLLTDKLSEIFLLSIFLSVP